MRSPRLRGMIAGLIGAAALALRPAPDPAAGGTQDGKPRPPRAAGKPVAMLSNLAAVTIRLGLKDQKGTAWDGEVRVSEGRLLSLTIAQGNVKGKVADNT